MIEFLWGIALGFLFFVCWFKASAQRAYRPVSIIPLRTAIYCVQCSCITDSSQRRGYCACGSDATFPVRFALTSPTGLEVTKR